MELKFFLEKVKAIKSKNPIADLSLEVLQLEEQLNDSTNKTKEIIRFGELFKTIFVVVAENKVEISNAVNELDLDYWKNNIGKFRIKDPITKETYLYTLRNSLKDIIKYVKEQDPKNTKVYLFELIIKTFLYIDFVALSIDYILDKAATTIPKENIKDPIVVPKKEEEPTK